MKNVTNRNAKSTMGVMSNDGVERGIFTFGILLFFAAYTFNKRKVNVIVKIN